MKNWLLEVIDLVRETIIEWLEDEIPARGAALSYYVLLSLGPLLLLVVGGLEVFFAGEQVRSGVIAVMRENVGTRAAATVETVLSRVQVPELLAPESFLTIALLIFGATAAFTNVRSSLNAIWGIEEEAESAGELALGLLRARLRGFTMVVVTGLVLLLSFAVSAGAGIVGELLEERLRIGSILVWGLNAAASILLIGVLFAAIYRTLPARQIPMSTVWIGAFATAVLFVAGKSLVAWVIRNSSWASYYGQGSSVVAFLAWIYFSAQLFFLGAEFTQVWSRRRTG